MVWAAEHGAREMVVGGPTLLATIGQQIIPGLLDRYMARAAWEPQFTDTPNGQQQDILFGTIAGDPGARGPYREIECGPDLQLRLRTHLRAVVAVVGLSAVAALAWGLAPTSRPHPRRPAIGKRSGVPGPSWR